MAKLKRRWQVLAVALAVWWAGYLAFDLLPPIRTDAGRIYLINASFLREAIPRCLATEDWPGCFGLLVDRLNAVEVHCRAIIVLVTGIAVRWLHARLCQRYTKMEVL